MRGQKDTKKNKKKCKGGKHLNNIVLKVKVQSIYYQSRKDDLGITYATSEKRITIAEAEDILLDRKIEFKEVLKVKYEFIDLEIPLEKFEDYIIQ